MEVNANRSEWMNETWGPPIKDSEGKLVPCTTKPPENRNPAQMKKLTPQYSNRKRRGTTPPEDLPSNKRSKKWRKIFVSPNDEDGHEGSSATGTKKLVLLSPNQTEADRKPCVRCHKEPEYGFLLACMICYRKVYCSVYCKLKRNERNCSSVCRPEPDPIAFLNKEGESSDSSALPSVPDLDIEMDDASSSSEDERPPGMAPRGSPEPDQGDEIELSNSQLWDIVDFRISKCGRCLIYVFEHVTTQEKKSFPADFMIGGDWSARLETFWLADNEEAWRKRVAMENPFGGVKHETGTPFGRMILSARFDDDRFLDFNIRDHEVREPDEEGDCTEYQLASLLEPDWDDLIKQYWKYVETKQDWERRAKIVNEFASFQGFSRFEPDADPGRARDIEKLTIEAMRWKV